MCLLSGTVSTLSHSHKMPVVAMTTLLHRWVALTRHPAIKAGVGVSIGYGGFVGLERLLATSWSSTTLDK